MKVLLVEDAPILLATIAEALDEEGYAVDKASCGQEALDKLACWEYDIVILDVMLPDMDGFEILTVIRGSTQTPVLMLTARDAITDRIRGLDLGADDYLTKPFDLLELLARMRSIRRRQNGNRSPRLSIGEIDLDTSRKQASRAGDRVELTSREYAILETLMSKAGRVVSRDFLYEHLYAEDDSTLSNVLDVYISRLRSKLGKDFITTKRGFGYIVEGAK